MKAIFTLVLVVLGLGLNAQCEHRSDFGVSHEVFDWRQEFWTFYLRTAATGGQTQMRTVLSPFEDSFIADRNIIHLANTPFKDYEIEEGWELLVASLGTVLEPVTIPMVVLYNRHESNMRVFMYSIEDEEFQTAKALTRFSEQRSEFGNANFGFLNIPVKALEDFDINNKPESPNFWENTGTGTWIFQDFPVMYDPCVCYYSSAFENSAILTSIQTITLNLDGEGTIEQIIEEDEVQSNSFTSTINKIGEGATKGLKTYKSVGSFVESIEKELPPVQEAQDLVVNWPNGTSTLSSIEKVPFKFPSWIGNFSSIGGAAFTLVDFLINGGKKEETQKPMNFDVNLDFVGDGSITEEAPYRVATYGAPGALGNLEERPAYDNPLGLIAIMERPEVLTQARFIRSFQCHDEPGD